MMSQTNLGNAMTIINNTARRLVHSEALVAWAETRRLVLNVMKPNKQFRQRQISAILLMMMMCWASQSSAQPTRAEMWISDMPVDAGAQAVLIAKASETQNKTLHQKIVGVCRTINASSATIAPEAAAAAADYMYRYQHVDGFGADATIRVVQPPMHGVLRFSSQSGDDKYRTYEYVPLVNHTYDPVEDSFVMQVESNGVKVTVRYYLNIQEPDESFYEYCSKDVWKISATTPNGTPIFSNEDTAASSASTYTPMPFPLISNYSNTAYPNLTYSFTNLPGTAVGQTTGVGTAANILLDINAAGRGWFMDSTPLSNDDYLPTSNPNEWIAKAGSAAADKMDLLSVLLHEYGHALGFEHSSDPHDFMGTSLTAGVRRLPTADEMQLMANLIGEIRTQNQRHSALDAESRTSFNEIAGLARNDKLLNDKLYSSRRLG